MRIPGWKWAKLTGRKLRSRFVGRGLILGYHSVSEVEVDPFGLFVSKEHFAEHLEVLSDLSCIIPLREMSEGLRRGDLPSRAVSITFDDGYLDNLPVLTALSQDRHLSATVFVIEGLMGETTWWDRLAEVVKLHEKLPATLKFDHDSAVINLNLYPEESDSELGSLMVRLFRNLWGIDEEHRRKILNKLESLLELDASDSPRRIMSAEEAKQLADIPNIEVGAHTVSHPALARLSMRAQRNEIMEAKLGLEKKISKQVLGFAYPHGSVSQGTLSAVADAGYMYACGSVADTVRLGSNIYHLPRISVGDWSGGTLRRVLREWLG